MIMDKVIIFGNGIENWIINEAFSEIRNSRIKNIKWAEPYNFTDDVKSEYFASFFSEQRKILKGHPASRWRKYSNVLRLRIKEDNTYHLFFLYGRDIQRLYDPVLLEWVKDKYGDKVKTYLILFDSINVTQHVNGWGNVVSIFDSFDYVCSFDPEDCKRHGLIPFYDPFPKHKFKGNHIFDNRTDLFFIGEEKGRGQLLKQIALGASEHHVKASLIIPDMDDTVAEIPGIVKSEYIPYRKALQKALSSKCLLELVADGQSGCSFRYYEAVVYNKKLISNCASIVNMPHYDPRYMKLIQSEADIDYDWINNGDIVDYHYKDEFSVKTFTESIISAASEREPSVRKPKVSNPLVSVVIPTYNRERTIKASVQSVLDQTYQNLEVIVVDDGSTDGTKNIVSAIDDPRVHLIIQKNQGACVARNTGIEAARGLFIAFQDSDDEWFPEKLETQLRVFDQEIAVDVVFCDAMKYTEDGTNTGEKLVTENISGIVPRDILQSKSLVSTQTMLMRSSCLQDIKFDPEMPRLQDFDLVYRLCESYAFYYVDRPLVKMYMQSDSISANPRKSIIARKRMIEKYPYVMQRNRNAYIDMLSMIVRNTRLIGEPDSWAEEEFQRIRQCNKRTLKDKIMRRYFDTIHFLEVHLPEKQMETLRKWYQPIKRIIFRLPKDG